MGTIQHTKGAGRCMQCRCIGRVGQCTCGEHKTPVLCIVRAHEIRKHPLWNGDICRDTEQGPSRDCGVPLHMLLTGSSLRGIGLARRKLLRGGWGARKPVSETSLPPLAAPETLYPRNTMAFMDCMQMGRVRHTRGKPHPHVFTDGVVSFWREAFSDAQCIIGQVFSLSCPISRVPIDYIALQNTICNQRAKHFPVHCAQHLGIRNI